MTRPRQAIPTFRDLLPDEVDAILSRNHVGRIAYSFHDSVDIRPIHYVYSDGWLYGRTSPGDKLMTLRHNQWVAFEVDEISGPLDWKSAVVRGTFYHLDPEGSKYDVRAYERALRLIRELAPATLAAEDPLAFRSEFFGISIDTATGRASSTGRKA
ncbi:MAG: pyridoxamine 5'-phosphate oxidase family protein [Gemmatimonadaceae bacterium]|nr:pyridoxamine 5'-phosphate oxidase family protein [Gemmatimonadaceae bacterium]